MSGKIGRFNGSRARIAAVTGVATLVAGASLTVVGALDVAAATTDAAITITPATVSQDDNLTETLTAHVTVNTGSGFVAAPDGTTVDFSLSNDHGASGRFVAQDQCTTSGGTCTVQLATADEGQTTVTATTTVDGITRTTGDGLSSDGPSAVVTWVDAFVDITPHTGTFPTGSAQTFSAIVMVNQGLGDGYVPAANGQVVTWSLTDSNGAASSFVGAKTCTTSGGTGTCTVQVTSSKPGNTTVHASIAVVVGGITLQRSTSDGLSSSGVDANVAWTGAPVTPSPTPTPTPTPTPRAVTTANPTPSPGGGAGAIATPATGAVSGAGVATGFGIAGILSGLALITGSVREARRKRDGR